MLQPKVKKAVKKYVPTAKEKKNLEDATKMKNMRPVFKSGGTTEDNSSFAKLAPPYNKATYADKIAGATKGKAKNGKPVKKAGMHKMPNGSMMKNSKMKMKMGGSIKKAQNGIVEPSAARIKAVQQKTTDNVNKIAMKNLGDSIKTTPPGTIKNGGSVKKCKYGCK